VGDGAKRPVEEAPLVVVASGDVALPVELVGLPTDAIFPERLLNGVGALAPRVLERARGGVGVRDPVVEDFVRRDPRVVAVAVLVLDAGGSVEGVVFDLLVDGLGSRGPLFGDPPVADFDGVVDDVVKQLVVLE
jgi:hypothetical protein